jgi:predicted RNase H-like nuclease
MSPRAPAAVGGKESSWTLVGIDCALDEHKLGLARGSLDVAGKLTVERVTLGTAGESAAASVSAWIERAEAYVVALNAPLGWPAQLAPSISQHRAGEPLVQAPEALFRRQTDQLVHKAVGKWPPEMGADRIARTAWAALGLLAEVRALSSRALPLVFRQSEPGVIEVFPPATLRARGLSGAGYKAKTHAGRRARGALLERLAGELELGVAHDLLIEDPNQFDALLCVLAAADFARALCIPPSDLILAKQEGFIWFRSSGQRLLPYADDRDEAAD